MDFEKLDDEALLTARSLAEAGPSFEVFYARHERLIVAFHMRRAGDPDLAADLTAETFAQALASRHRFAPAGPSSAARWLYGIARNVLRRSARDAQTERHKMQRLGLERSELGDHELGLITRAAEDGAVFDALDALPPHQRDVIRAFVLDDDGYAEIAARAGLGEATVRKRVSRGLTALRRTLEETR